MTTVKSTPFWKMGSSLRFFDENFRFHDWGVEPWQEASIYKVRTEAALGKTTLTFRCTESYRQPPQRCFTCFSKLPIELQLKVWMYSCFLTRNVDIVAKLLFVCDDDIPSRNEDLFPAFCSACPAPAVLSTCRDSRTAGLKHYSREFGTQQKIFCKTLQQYYEVTRPAKIYINWVSDRILLASTDWLNHSPQESRESAGLGSEFQKKSVENGLRHFALNIRDFANSYSAFKMIPWGAGLKELVLFDENEAEWDCITLESKSNLTFRSIPKSERTSWTPVEKQIYNAISIELKKDENFKPPIVRLLKVKEAKGRGNLSAGYN